MKSLLSLFFLVFFSVLSSAQNNKANKLDLIILENHYTLKQYDSIVNNEFKKGKIPVLYYSASWCGPCVKFKKMIKENNLFKTKLKNFTFIQADVSSLSNCEKDTIKLGDILGCRDWQNFVPRFSKIGKKGEDLNFIMGSSWFMEQPYRIDDFIKMVMTPRRERFIFESLKK
ncbi:thioredoxin domain-containing protein [Flavobacterium sp. AC]|uniref:Thioredoxin domain-containing protein n=1 Tax=Flavobacterium azizsancarii TaxID=2961580 RepID=A0ABT4WE14_9FLAO|nr:thioredoxin domain-containing protein [Flavobacterium azizsancarii]MDA6070685.1 thioredoxin domain-containing protein [Flavobacterium azizsancarii]